MCVALASSSTVAAVCLMLHPVRWLLRRRLMLVLALLNRQRQPERSMSLVVSRQREAEIPPALMMHPHRVWPAISDILKGEHLVHLVWYL